MKIPVLYYLLFCASFVSKGQTETPLEIVLQKGHTNYIRAYAFSADNKYVVSGGFDNVLILWNVQSGKQIRTFSGHTQRIRSIKFSPDQKKILSVSADNTAKIFEVETGRLIHSFTIVRGELDNGYYSPDGKYAYILDDRNGTHVWNTTSGDYVGEFEKNYSAHNEQRLISNDEQRILTVDRGKYIAELSLATRDTLLYIPFDKAYSLSYSPDNKYIAVSSRKLFASVFNSETGDLVNTFRYGEEKCDGCNTVHVFSPDSKQLLTMSKETGAVLWDIRSGKKIKLYLEFQERPNQVKFSKSGTYILLSFSDDIFIFDAKTGAEKLHVNSDKLDYFDISFSSNEKYIVLPNDNGGLDLWNVSKGKLQKTIKGYLNDPNGNDLGFSYSNWIEQSILSYIQHKRKVLFSPDNEHVVIAGADSEALLIQVKTGRIVKTFKGHTKAIIAFDFSPDGKHLATAGGDRVVKVWEVATGREVITLKGHQGLVFDLQFNSDGKYIISGSWDGSMRIWDWREGKQEYIPFEKGSPYCVGFTPNDLYIVSADLDNNFQFWERDAIASFRTLVGHTSIPSSFDFSTDAKNIVTCSWDGTVKLWDVLTGMLVGKMTDHNGSVYTVKFDPWDRFVASGGGDGQIILWDHKRNTIHAILKGHATSVTSIDITSDGKYLVSMSIDGLMKVWDLTTNKIIYSRAQMGVSEWIATNEYGYFDGSSKALGLINYVKGNQVITVSNLFEKYYSPDLINRVWNKESGLDDSGSTLEKEMNNIPYFEVLLGSAGIRSVDMQNDSVFTSKIKDIPIEVEIGEHVNQLEEIRIYNNGKLVEQKYLEENISFRGGGKKKHQFKIGLTNGDNEIKVIIINESRTESDPTKLLVHFDGEKAKTDLYILAIGINKYKNPTYNLSYAVNDAKAFLKTIKKGADSLFNTVHTYSILNADATKENITKTIKEINAEIGSEDVFVFYYAGHGVMSNEVAPKKSEFFIVTHDVTNLYDSPEIIREKAISATELMAISMNVSAEKQLFILDACHSGGAIESFAVRGSEREKALAQLARNTGTFFITAAQDAEYANEVGKLNHGLFTYALLEILQGDIAGDDQKITVNELKSYVEERVPELSEEYHGSPQYPTGYSFGRDFPIVILK